MVFGLGKRGLDARGNMLPHAHVEWFLLTPNDFCVWIIVCMLLELLVWERVELLDAGNGDIVHSVLLASSQQCIVNLAGAQNMLLYLIGRAQVLWVRVRQVQLEPLVACHILERRTCQWMPQHGFRKW